MNESTQNLATSLVGGSIDYSFRNKLSGAVSIDENIRSTRDKISRDVEMALSVGGKLCVMLLAEITNFYRREPYYMALRSAIEMRRFRPMVLDYLKLDIEERAERLKSVLSEKLRLDRNRDLKVSIARYFLGTYPNRLKEFKHLFTREEYLLVV